MDDLNPYRTPQGDQPASRMPTDQPPALELVVTIAVGLCVLMAIVLLPLLFGI